MIYNTWDITDSTIIVDAESPFPDTNSYTISNGKLIWGKVEEDVNFIYDLEKDTLMLQRDSVSDKMYLVKKYKCTPEEHFFNSAYLDLQLNTDLPISSQAEVIDRKVYGLKHIFIGKQKLFHSHKSNDSISIQVDDVLLDYSDIPEYLKEVSWRHIHGPRLTPALYIDKNTPMHIIDRVKYEIAKSNFRLVGFMCIQDTLHTNFYQGIGMILPQIDFVATELKGNGKRDCSLSL